MSKPPLNRAGFPILESRNKPGFALVFDGLTPTGRPKYRTVETLVKAQH